MGGGRAPTPETKDIFHPPPFHQWWSMIRSAGDAMLMSLFSFTSPHLWSCEGLHSPALAMGTSKNMRECVSHCSCIPITPVKTLAVSCLNYSIVKNGCWLQNRAMNKSLIHMHQVPWDSRKSNFPRSQTPDVSIEVSEPGRWPTPKAPQIVTLLNGTLVPALPYFKLWYIPCQTWAVMEQDQRESPHPRNAMQDYFPAFTYKNFIFSSWKRGKLG